MLTQIRCISTGLIFILVILFATGLSAEVQKNVDQKTEKNFNPLKINAKGLSGELQVILNKKEKLALKGNKTFEFKTKLEAGDLYSVKIDRQPPNHNCELHNAFGHMDEEKREPIEAICTETGKWLLPTSLDDAISAAGQDAGKPAVAMNDRNEAIVVWSRFEGKTWHVIQREYRDGKWLSEMIVSPGAKLIEGVNVALADNGDVVVIWEQVRGRGKRDIMMAERRNGKWKLPPDSETSHVSLGNKFSFEADVAISSGGDTVVVWSQASDNGLNAIYKSEYRNKSWQHPKDLKDKISPDGNDALRPQVAINNSGDAIIVWEQDINDISLIFKSEFRKGKWSNLSGPSNYISPLPVDEKNRGAYRPLVSMDNDGNAVVSWQQAHGKKDRIYMSEYRDGKWKHPESIKDAISPPEAGASQINDLAMDNKGRAVILWTNYEMRKHALYKSEYKKGKWSHPGITEEFVSSPLSTEFYIEGEAAMSDSGKTLAGWMQRGVEKKPAVFYSEYDHSQWYFPGHKIAIDDKSASDLTLSSSVNGNFIMVWRQSDGKNNRIFAGLFKMLAEKKVDKVDS
jgi:hypothetical protein